ncbi:zinc ribbon domain-containing protein [Utexia brackfieldae]|uniref:zinc ribbon domain-containing protein n=1 Tax=Utexia brackfieldae TaxID=3074108 RepID=UPI00370DD4E6
MKMCIACGMPMTAIADYPLCDISKNYCKHCAHADGSMHTFDERLAILADFMVNKQGIDSEIAKQTAYILLKKLPAWKRKI